VAEFLETVWLPAEEGRVEVGTYEQYRLVVSRHIVPLIGGLGGVPLQASPAPGAYGAITGNCHISTR
jgi:hypothetical protein